MTILEKLPRLSPVPSIAVPFLTQAIGLVHIFSSISVLVVIISILILSATLVIVPIHINLSITVILFTSLAVAIAFISVVTFIIVVQVNNSRKLRLLNLYINGDLSAGEQVTATVIKDETNLTGIVATIDDVFDTVELTVDRIDDTTDIVQDIAATEVHALSNANIKDVETGVNGLSNTVRDKMLNITEQTTLLEHQSNTSHIMNSIIKNIRNNPLFIFETVIRDTMRVAVIVSFTIPAITSAASVVLFALSLRAQAGSLAAFSTLAGPIGPTFIRRVRRMSLEKIEHAVKEIANEGTSDAEDYMQNEILDHTAVYRRSC